MIIILLVLTLSYTFILVSTQRMDRESELLLDMFSQGKYIILECLLKYGGVNVNKHDIKRDRIGAIIIDSVFLCIVSYIFTKILESYFYNTYGISSSFLYQNHFDQNFRNAYYLYELVMAFPILIAIFIETIFFDNRSIGKRIMGLEVKFKSNYKAKGIILYARRVLTLLLWPITLIIYIIFDINFWDKVFNTYVTKTNRS